MSAKPSESVRRLAPGFTLTELVVVIVILGILAVSVLPRMSTADFRGAQFHDQVVSALRYAQKVATSHRRMVCAGFTATTLTLTIDSSRTDAACPAINTLPLPGGSSNVLTSPDSVNVSFSPTPASLFFRPDGRITSDAAGTTATSPTLSITNAGTTIRIVGDTGLVD